MDIPSQKDLLKVGRDEILFRNGQIRAEQVDRDGSDVNIIVNTGAAMAEEVVRRIVKAFKRLTLSGASGADLDLLASDRYNVFRKPASPAVGEVTFSRTSGAAGGCVIPADTRVSTDTGKEYAVTEARAFVGTSVTPVIAPVQAVVAGADGNVVAGTITKIISTLTDSSLTVTNALRLTGGDNEEQDDSFRARVRNYFVTARRGTLDAIEFGAISVPGVRQAVANEIVTPGNDPARYAQVYIADKDGYASIQLINNVRLALQEYRAAGIKCDVIGGSTVFQEIQIEIAFPTGVNQGQIGADVKNAIVNSVNNLHCGETLLASSIISAARSVTNAIVGRLAYPLGDVVPADTEVIRTTFDRVSIVVISTPGKVFNNTTRDIQFGFEGGKVIPTL